MINFGSALAIVAGPLNFFNKEEQAQTEAQMARDRAFEKYQESNELMERAKINELALRRGGQEIKEKQISAYARGNVSVTSASPLMFMEATQAKVRDEIAIAAREASYKSEQLKRQATLLNADAARISEGTTIRGINSILNTGSEVARSERRDV